LTTNTEHDENVQPDPDGESSIIKELRAQLKASKTDLKESRKSGDDALVTARAQVKREAEASSLMSNAGFEGLADIFASEVDDELTAEAAAQWLKKRGLQATSESSGDEAASAEQVSQVADLGSQVASATLDLSEGGFNSKMDELEANTVGAEEFFKGLEKLSPGSIG